MSVCIVVLGMHGGGTSLVASMLDAMGVEMHYNPNAKVKWYFNYEDADFLRLDEQILKAAGGDWRRPPEPKRIAALESDERIQRNIKRLVERKQKALWGFKDPRLCLTIPLIHPHLTNPHYIRVTRNHQAVERSILSRGPATRTQGGWAELSKIYSRRADAFLKTIHPSRVFIVAFEDLVKDERTAGQQATQVARFLGLDDKAAKRAVQRIEFGKVLR